MSSLQIRLAHGLAELHRIKSNDLDHLWLCSAYVSKEGVEALTPLLRGAKSITAILGAGMLTDPDALRVLGRRRAEVLLIPHHPQAEFHPKCYMGVRRNGEAWAMIGSANLTRSGLGENLELGVLVEGEAKHPFFESVKKWLLDLQSHARPAEPGVIAELQKAHEAYAQVAAAGESAFAALAAALNSGPGWTAADFVRNRRQETLLSYIKTTDLYASYKLVILGLLLHAPSGRLGLAECARRFHTFYQRLSAAGVQAERSDGRQPLKMLQPDRLELKDVEDLLMDAPRESFGASGVVIYKKTDVGMEIGLSPSVWGSRASEYRGEAFALVLDRLEGYYRDHVGMTRGVRQALREAAIDLIAGTSSARKPNQGRIVSATPSRSVGALSFICEHVLTVPDATGHFPAGPESYERAEIYRVVLPGEVTERFFAVAYGWRNAYGQDRRRVIVWSATPSGQLKIPFVEGSGVDRYSKKKLIAFPLKQSDSTKAAMVSQPIPIGYDRLGCSIESLKKWIAGPRSSDRWAAVVEEGDAATILGIAVVRGRHRGWL